MSDVNSMIRVGIVSSVDKKNLKCRVFFPDMNNIVSDWMYVLQRPEEVVDVKSSEGHSHSAEVDKWLPKINARVVVVYPYGWNTNGFVLGAIP